MFLRFLGSFGLLILPQLFARNPLRLGWKPKAAVLISQLLFVAELVAGYLAPLTVLANHACRRVHSRSGLVISDWGIALFCVVDHSIF